ncbi:hypothetical protein J2Y63_006488 [Shinella sp. BE166]
MKTYVSKQLNHESPRGPKITPARPFPSEYEQRLRGQYCLKTNTLRVNGHATLVTDPKLLAGMSVNGRSPKISIIVKVREVFIHCAKALRRSHLWNPERFQDRSEMPSLIKFILDETTGAPSEEEMRKIDDNLEEEYKRTLTKHA